MVANAGITTWKATNGASESPGQNGDVALVDNYVTMHARRSFTGTRKVFAFLVAAENRPPRETAQSRG
jgi:hypothetical protein